MYSSILGLLALVTILSPPSRRRCLEYCHDKGVDERNSETLLLVLSIVGMSLVVKDIIPKTKKPSSSSLLGTIEMINEHLK